MNADWLIGVERWRKSLPPAPRAFVNILMGLAAVGISMLLFAVLFFGFFSSANAAIGMVWFVAVLVILYAIAEYHDRRRRR